MKKGILYNPLYICMALAFTANTVYAATTIMVDSDFPQGHMWINQGNPTYGGDVHFQNNQTVYLSGSKPNTGILSIEQGGKLVADGHVHVTNTGMGDAILVTNGGKAYFNDGFTSVAGPGNDYYSTAVNLANSEMHVKGTVNIIAEENIGYGL